MSRWVARYRAEGDTAFEARSRQPRTTIPDETVELVVNLRAGPSTQGLNAGPHTIAWMVCSVHTRCVVLRPAFRASCFVR